MSPVCFVDLDGVLVDFVGGSLRLHGFPLFDRRAVQWDMAAQLGIDPAEFWAPMGREFWEHLDWTPEGDSLLNGVERMFGDNVVILTSPCDTPGCVDGKLAWVRREIPHMSRRVLVGPPKHLIAGPGKVLVDDFNGNTDKFQAAGGATVLVPRPWNPRRGETDREGRFDVPGVLSELRDVAARLV